MYTYYDEYKELEQMYMVLKDQYAELARALGFIGDSWFGDPLASHEEILRKAKYLNNKVVTD